jgi:hypothetical protein
VAVPSDEVEIDMIAMLAWLGLYLRVAASRQGSFRPTFPLPVPADFVSRLTALRPCW